MTGIELDLRHTYNNSRAIDDALQQSFNEVVSKRIRELVIIPAKGGGQLQKKIERFLQQPSVKKYYQRMENDSKNSGRLIIYFKY